MARAAQPKDLAVGVLVGQSYRYVARHLGLFLRIGWFWFALSSALGALILRVVASAPGRYAAELIDIPLVIAFAVAWHRATLAGEVPGGLIGGRFGGREARYAGWLVLLMLAAFAVLVLGAVAAYLAVGEGAGTTQMAAMAILLVILVFTATRLILLFPAVALGDPRAGLAWSWRLTRGHGVALFLGFCAVSLPLLLVKYALMLGGAILLPTDVAGAAPFLLQPVYRIFDFANLAVSVAFMSFAYKSFTTR